MLFQHVIIPLISMPSTEPNILRPVDECFNRNRGKPCFRCVCHGTYKIAVKIEMEVSLMKRKTIMNTLNNASSRTFENGFLDWFT